MGSCGLSKKQSTVIVKQNKSNNQINQNNQQGENQSQNQNQNQNQNKKTENKKKEILIEDDKYKDLEEYENDFSGEGIKRMKAYKWNSPYDLLYQLRFEFWNSHKENKKIWSILKQACESDHLSALGILTSVDIQVLDGCISQTVDNEGNVYKIPNFCINDPLYKKELKKIEESGVGVNILINIVDIFNPSKSTTVKIQSNISCGELKRCFAQAKNISLEKNKIRALYNGCEVLDEHLLSQHSIGNNSKVQFVIQEKELKDEIIEKENEKENEKEKEKENENENKNEEEDGEVEVDNQLKQKSIEEESKRESDD